MAAANSRSRRGLALIGGAATIATALVAPSAASAAPSASPAPFIKTSGKHLVNERTWSAPLPTISGAPGRVSKKILDTGTNIGPFIEEGKQGIDRDDFRLRYSVANKEAFKTNFLLRLIRDSELISQAQARSLLDDCEELQKMLVATIKTVKKSE